jgi:hypothetical protein
MTYEAWGNTEMARLLRMLSGAAAGVLLGLAVGTGLGGVILVVSLPNELPMDRWDNGVRILALLAGSGTAVGLISGLASRIPKHGLSLVKSTAIVAIGGLVAVVLAPNVKSGWFLPSFLIGILFGGIAAVGAGMARSHATRVARQDKEDAANKVQSQP